MPTKRCLLDQCRSRHLFGRAGIKLDEEVLQDAKDICAKVPRAKGLGVHVPTGPIYVESAEPGDALEVRVLDLEFRVPHRRGSIATRLERRISTGLILSITRRSRPRIR